MVNPFRIVLIPWSWILGYQLTDRLELVFSQPVSEAILNPQLKLLPGVFVHETAADSAVRIGIFDVGLDVVNRSSVGKVGAFDFDYALFGMHAYNAHGAEPKGVGPVGRARGEDPYALIAAEPRRTHCQTALARAFAIEVETPYQPDVVEILKAAQGVSGLVLRQQCNPSPKRRDDTRLPRKTELFFQRAVIYGDRFNFH